MNQLVYLVYGNNQNIIDEARFSIVSAIYQSSKNNNTLNIVIITDTPEFFKGFPVTIKIITQHQLSAWSGKENYHHRSKPEALLCVIDKADKTILIDTDTIFKKDPENLFKLIDQNSILVDKIYQKWNQTPDSYYNTCREFLVSHYNITDDMRHINSGIIGITKNNKRIIKQSLIIIDQIYNLSGRLFHTEQFALAASIFSNKIKPIQHKSIIHHYWSRKNIYRAIARSFLNTHKDLFSENARNDFFKLEFKIPKPPWHHRLYLKLRSRKLPNKKQLRQFYIEICKAIYSTHQFPESVQSEMLKKSLINLKERNFPLFNLIQKKGVKSIISPSLLKDKYIKELNTLTKNIT